MTEPRLFCCAAALLLVSIVTGVCPGRAAAQAVTSGPPTSQSINLLPNPSFEHGDTAPLGWIPYPYKLLGQSLVWGADGHDGKRSLVVGHSPDHRSWSTVVAVLPGTTYRIRAWARVEGDSDPAETQFAFLKVVERDESGKNVTAKDSRGIERACVTQAFPARVNGWQLIEKTFLTDGRTRSLQLLLVGTPGLRSTAVFDEISLTEAEDPRLDGAWINQVDTAVVTPHVPWAKPLAGGKLKVFCLVNQPGKRELVELWQRLDMDFTEVVAVSPAALGFPSSAATWRGSSEFEKQRDLQEKLSARYDCYLIGGVDWLLIPIELRHLILERASQGAGVVIVMQQKGRIDELDLLRAHAAPQDARETILGAPGIAAGLAVEGPTGLSPPVGRTCLKDVVTPCLISRGRAVLLEYPYPEHLRYPTEAQSAYHGTSLSPYVTYGPETLHQYEYFQQTLIRAVLWAAGRWPKPVLRVEGTVFEEAGPQTLAVRAIDAPAAGMRLWHRLQSDKGVILDEGIAPVTGPVTTAWSGQFAAGDYLLDLRLMDDKGLVHAFGSFPVTVRGPVRITGIATDGVKLHHGVLAGTVSLSAATDGRLRFTLRDIHRRLILDTLVTGTAAERRFELELPDNIVARLHVLEAELLDAAGQPIARDSTRLSVPLRDAHDVSYYVWGSAGGGDITSYLLTSHIKRAMGADLYEAGFYSTLSAARQEKRDPAAVLLPPHLLALTEDQVTVPYTIPVLYTGTNLVRSPSINDVGWRRTFDTLLGFTVDFYRRHGLHSPVYSLGDEFLLAYPGGPDVDFSEPTQRRFRTWLQDKYRDLSRLNEIWGTSYTAWEQVAPITLEDAKRQNQPARWLDHRLHMDDVIVDLLEGARDQVRKADPDGKIGFEGMFRSYSECGYDVERIASLCDFLVSYEYPYRWEMLASFGRPGGYYGVFSNSYRGQPNGTKYQVWKALLHGLNSIWYWRLNGATGFLDSDLSGGPHPLRYDNALTQARNVSEARKGPARLLQLSRRSSQPIAILHNQESLHASKWYGGASALSDSWAGFQSIFEDLGFGYRYVKTADLIAGTITPEKTKVLVLPYAVCLPDTAIMAIKQYVADGGTVLADLRPAMLDQYGRYADAGALDPMFGIRRTAGESLVKAQAGGIGTLALDAGVRTAGGTAQGAVDGVPFGIRHAQGKGCAILLNFGSTDYGAALTANDFSLSQFKADFDVNASVRELVADLLGPAGVRPIVGVGGANTNVAGIEQYEHRSGSMRLIGLTRKIYGRSYARAADEQTVHCGKASHVYDVRAGTYLGHVDTATVHLGLGDTVLLALLPTRPKLDELRLTIDKAAAGHPLIQVSGRFDAGGGPDLLHVLRLEVMDPAGRQVEWYARNIQCTGSAFSATVPLALNDPKGEWKVRVRDVATGEHSQATCSIE